MDGLESGIRASLEESLDNFINDPEGTEKIVSMLTDFLGINTNWETILSYIAGTSWGLVTGLYASKYSRTMNNDESSDFMKIMRRRSRELRQSFIDTRIINNTNSSEDASS